MMLDQRRPGEVIIEQGLPPHPGPGAHEEKLGEKLEDLQIYRAMMESLKEDDEEAVAAV